MTGLGETMFTAPEMAAVFSGRSLVQRMLDFEAALSRAQARAGIVPQAAVEAIAIRCRADLFDLDALFRDAAASATPAVPLVRMLTDLVDGEAKRYVHWGATSQDAIDTAMMLQIRDGLDLLISRLLAIGAACAGLAGRHRDTPMGGRTLLQHAVPITFGLKSARWLAVTTRVASRLHDVREHTLAVQLGGAAGTLASSRDQGILITEYLADELGLPAPDLPWHAERDRIAEISSAVGVVAGAMAKIATDLALLAQTEVGEISITAEGAAGRSSAMPHKRNPVEATAALACARLAIGMVSTVLGAMAQEHERAVGGWQAEWEAVPDVFRFTAGAVEWVHRAVTHLEVHPERMRANLEAFGGLIMAEALTMALAEQLGRPEAYRIVQEVSDRAVREGLHLRAAAGGDERIRSVLSAERLDRALDVSTYRGSTDAFVDRALAAFERARAALRRQK